MEEDEIGNLDFDEVIGTKTDSEVSFSNHDFVKIMKCMLGI